MSGFIKATLFEKETSILDVSSLHYFIKSSIQSINSSFTVQTSFVTFLKFFDSIDSRFSFLNFSLFSYYTDKHTILSIYEQAHLFDLFSLYVFNQPNKFMGFNVFNFFKPVNTWFKKNDYYLKLINNNKWNLLLISNDYYSNFHLLNSKLWIVSSLSFILNNNDIKTLIEQFNLLEFTNFITKKKRIYAFTYTNNLNVQVFSIFQLYNRLYKFFFFTMMQLPLFSLLHYSRIAIVYIRGTTTNFSLVVTKKQTLLCIL